MAPNLQEVEECVDKGESRLHPFRATSWDDVHDADQEKDASKDDPSNEEDLAASGRIDEEPGADVAEHSACRHTNAVVKCIDRGKAGKLKEIR